MASLSPTPHTSVAGTTPESSNKTDLSQEGISQTGGLRRLASIAAMSLALTNSEPARAQEGAAIAPTTPQPTYVVIRGADGVERMYQEVRVTPVQGAPVPAAQAATPQPTPGTNAALSIAVPPATATLPNIIVPGAASAYQPPPSVNQSAQQGVMPVDPVRQRMVEAQIAERQQRYNDQMAIRGQREVERLQRMEEQRVRQFHRERSEKVGWLLDAVLPGPKR
jgi:hypothetical protein